MVWQMVGSEEELVRIAATLAARPRSGTDNPHQGTAVGSALAFAATALKGGPRCGARTVDLSGDGANNQGSEPQVIYGGGLLDEVTVNALVIGGAVRRTLLVDADEIEAALVAWFEAEVMHGPGAFWILADGYADYERAMRAKLLRELQVPLVSGEVRPADAG